MTDVDAVRAAQPKVEIYVYEGAQHGFGCDERGSYSKPDYDLAQQRTVDFFAKLNLAECATLLHAPLTKGRRDYRLDGVYVRSARGPAGTSMPASRERIRPVGPGLGRQTCVTKARHPAYGFAS